MKYSSFERLVLIVSTVAVLGAATVNLLGGPVLWTELIGQVLVLAVLAAAVHWGRNGGFIAAAAATVVYAMLAVPEVAAGGLKPGTVQLLLVHVVVYGIVGVVGGEVCSRLKYQLARLEGASALDDDTKLYAEPMVQGLVTTGLGRFRRYSTPFAVVELTVSPGLFAEFRPVKRRAMLRRVANFVRNDVRMVDDIGRLDDGRFVVRRCPPRRAPEPPSSLTGCSRACATCSRPATIRSPHACSRRTTTRRRSSASAAPCARRRRRKPPKPRPIPRANPARASPRHSGPRRRPLAGTAVGSAGEPRAGRPPTERPAGRCRTPRAA